MGLRSRRRRDERAAENACDGTAAADVRSSASLVDPDAAATNPFGDEHAWWAERDRLQRVFVMSAPDAPSDSKDRPLNDFWSPESLFTYDQRAGDEDGETHELPDPYAVLGVPVFATWADVTVAHRKLAKRYHPDLLADASDEERLEAEEHMRKVNQAYSQLQRVRRSPVT